MLPPSMGNGFALHVLPPLMTTRPRRGFTPGFSDGERSPAGRKGLLGDAVGRHRRPRQRSAGVLTAQGLADTTSRRHCF
jgi:hypothetical protein